MPAFSPIKPAPDRDTFAFDFTKEIGATGRLASVTWTCENSAYSVKLDPTPEARIISQPVFDNYKTSALCGDMIEGVIYFITCQGNIDDGRIITLWGEVECSFYATATEPWMTVEQFRAEFPTFSNPAIYTDASIAFWINQVTFYTPIDPIRWGQFYNLGLRLWVAHNLTIQAAANRNATSAQLGPGVPASKSVNGVSLSYDLGFGQEYNAGWYGTTPYGNQFLYYLRLAGSGPIQL